MEDLDPEIGAEIENRPFKFLKTLQDFSFSSANNSYYCKIFTLAQQPVIAAFGNPLLDMIVSDEAGDLVTRFRLERNVAQEVDTLARGLYQEVVGGAGGEVATSGGGCALNTSRCWGSDMLTRNYILILSECSLGCQNRRGAVSSLAVSGRMREPEVMSDEELLQQCSK